MSESDMNAEVKSVIKPKVNAQAKPCYHSHDLLRGEREIIIFHNDGEYRLRHTSKDKLILTK